MFSDIIIMLEVFIDNIIVTVIMITSISIRKNEPNNKNAN